MKLTAEFRYSVVPTLAAIACAAAWIPVYAATSAEYPAVRRYTDKSKKVKYSGPCTGNFGLAGMNSPYGARYIMTFPNKSEITVYLYENDLATINDIPAKRLPSPPKTVRFLTGQNEEFQFSTPPPGSM